MNPKSGWPLLAEASPPKRLRRIPKNHPHPPRIVRNAYFATESN
jgi:hypothetical protein